MTSRPTVVEAMVAMEILLTKKQIAFVKSQTYAGQSKVEVVRSLLNKGIKQVEAADERLRNLSNVVGV